MDTAESVCRFSLLLVRELLRNESLALLGVHLCLMHDEVGKAADGAAADPETREKGLRLEQTPGGGTKKGPS